MQAGCADAADPVTYKPGFTAKGPSSSFKRLTVTLRAPVRSSVQRSRDTLALSLSTLTAAKLIDDSRASMQRGKVAYK